MSRLFATNIDLAKNELLNARVQNLASAPSSPVEGQVYYDTTTDKFGIYNGATWDYMGTGSGSTNLSQSLTATTVAINSDTGTDVTIAAADTTNAGVMTKAMFDKLTGIEALADVTDAANVVAAGAYVSGGTDVSVADGGTGRSTSTTAYGLIAAGTTATGAHQTIAPGTSGHFLKSAGASALASFAAIAQGDVTNLVSDLAAKAPLASPTFTGVPAAPTATAGTNTTQVATTAFVSAATAALVDAAPGTLDTLNELAAALGDDANFATTTSTALGLKMVKTANLSDVANAATAFSNIKQDASTTATGVVELATQAEAQAKTDTTRALTAASVADFARKYTGLIGNGSLTSLPVTHGLGSQYVTAQVFDATTNAQIECDVVLTSSTVTTFSFAVAPTTNQYRVVITG